MDEKTKIKSFTDLKVWQEGHRLVILIYKFTGKFPSKETYSITDQMRRSSASITANIAEGFGRRGYKEKLQFYYLAQGSLLELKNFLLIARDVAYLNSRDFSVLADQSNQVHKLLQGLIQKTKRIVNS